jgi:DNA-binding transcriptional ArsR family regulator
MQSATTLDLTFQALSDATRRSMLDALARGEACSAGELGSQFSFAQPTISKHLKVLERAGLIERTIDGRVHRFRLRQEPLQDAGKWLARHHAFWEGAVGRLDRLLSEAPDDER